jgi:hypothetical protein
MSALMISGISSFLSSLLLLVISHVDDLRFLLGGPRRYGHLNGEWFQYHLTLDSKHASGAFWSVHREVLKMTRFGHVRGESTGLHSPQLRYRIAGEIRQHIMSLRFTNASARELIVNITYPCLLADDVLVGVWVGHDYDEHLRNGPIVLSRIRRTAGELAAITRDGHQLSVPRHGLIPPVVDTSEGPVIQDEHGNTESGELAAQHPTSVLGPGRVVDAGRQPLFPLNSRVVTRRYRWVGAKFSLRSRARQRPAPLRPSGHR